MTRRLPVVIMPMAKAGTEIEYKGWPYEVDHISVSSKGIKIFLKGVSDPVWMHSPDVKCPLYEIDFEQARQNSPTYNCILP